MTSQRAVGGVWWFLAQKEELRKQPRERVSSGELTVVLAGLPKGACFCFLC